MRGGTVGVVGIAHEVAPRVPEQRQERAHHVRVLALVVADGDLHRGALVVDDDVPGVIQLRHAAGERGRHGEVHEVRAARVQRLGERDRVRHHRRRARIDGRPVGEPERLRRAERAVGHGQAEGRLAGVVHLQLIERQVERHHRRRHHDRVRRDGVGERLAVRDRLQRRARHRFLQLREQRQVGEAVDGDLIEEVRGTDLRLLEGLAEERAQLGLRLGPHEPGVHQAAQGRRICFHRGDLLFRRRQPEHQVLHLGDVDAGRDRLERDRARRVDRAGVVPGGRDVQLAVTTDRERDESRHHACVPEP